MIKYVKLHNASRHHTSGNLIPAGTWIKFHREDPLMMAMERDGIFRQPTDPVQEGAAQIISTSTVTDIEPQPKKDKEGKIIGSFAIHDVHSAFEQKLKEQAEKTKALKDKIQSQAEGLASQAQGLAGKIGNLSSQVQGAVSNASNIANKLPSLPNLPNLPKI